jgi:predicted DNA-binding protein
MANVNIRLPESEKEIIKQYCKENDRTETDLIREFIRGLEAKLKPS